MTSDEWLLKENEVKITKQHNKKQHFMLCYIFDQFMLAV